MRYLLPVLLLASLGMAIQFGPAGMPLDWRNLNIEWMESSKFTSPSATSNLSMTGDTLTFALTGASANRDITLRFKEEDGTHRDIVSDDGISVFHFLAPRYRVGDNVDNSVQIASIPPIGYIQTLGTVTTLSIAATGATTGGIVILGEDDKRDITLINSRLCATITTVAVATTMGTSDGYMYTMTANDTLRCPTTPLAGEVLMCKFTNAAGGWIKGMGNTIDGASEVAASENDNIMIVWNATTSEWEVR